MIERGIEAGLFAEELIKAIKNKRREAHREAKRGQPLNALVLLDEIEAKIREIEETYQNA